MKVYVKYKTKVVRDFIFTSIKFQIKIRLNCEKYKIFKNTFTKSLQVDCWEETENLLKGDGLISIVKGYIKEYLEKTKYEQAENSAENAENNVYKLLNKNWKEVELIIEM